MAVEEIACGLRHSIAQCARALVRVIDSKLDRIQRIVVSVPDQGIRLYKDIVTARQQARAVQFAAACSGNGACCRLAITERKGNHFLGTGHLWQVTSR